MWILAGVFALLLITAGVCTWFFRPRSLSGDPALREKTTIAPSIIPGAGRGLFAARDLKQGERVADMGGRLVFERSVPRGKRGFLYAVPECAEEDIWPWDAVDGSRGGGPGSMINFAPSRINGIPTGFQNVRGVLTCDPPYVVFEAIRDIPAGTELWTSYGPVYGYDFMDVPAVRDFFCDLAGLDCSSRFDWEP